ncbi:MAG: hypothetical protein GYA23_11820 [Methanomicrobiales archaeon]|nr:hypothetical protein [Methanomicrobiales archaeon]
MQEVRLTIRKRSFPSQGRVRIHVTNLSALEASDGDNVDLVNETAKRTITATIIADRMVRDGEVRVSEEDLSALGLSDGDTVLVVRSLPLMEKAKNAASGAGASLAKTAGEVKTEAGKAATGLAREAGKAGESIGKTAKKTAGDIKKAVKDASGKDNL